MRRRPELEAACLLLLMAACGVRHHELLPDAVLDSVLHDAAPAADAGAQDASSDLGAGRTGGAAGGAGGAGPSEPHQPSAHCNGKACACDDGEDNDADGLSDGLDPECTGAFDDDETSFGIGKPNKQNQCRDCFWIYRRLRHWWMRLQPGLVATRQWRRQFIQFHYWSREQRKLENS